MEQLEMYVSAGLSMNQALGVMAKGSSKKKSVCLERIKGRVEAGHNVSIALSEEICLPASVVGLIACGEMTGSLAQTLKACHTLLDGQDELVKKVVSSMTYPIVIGMATVGLTIGLVQGILPQIIPLLSGLRVELPLLTRAVINTSWVITNYGLFIVGGIAAFIGASIFAYKKSLNVRLFFHSCLLCVPIIGKLARYHSLALFFQSFGLMTEAGIMADVAYEKATRSVFLIPLQRKLAIFIEPIRNGEKFHVIAKDMPAYVASFISAGEASGNLGHSLSRVALMIGRDLEYALKRLTSLVEPAMMMGMGGMVGSIALSIMMPIYDISKTLQH